MTTNKRAPTSQMPPGNLPLYKSHKQVRAFQIDSMVPSPDGRLIYLKGRVTRHTARVSAGYMFKHNPQVGGYYVLYKDGYESWSPAEAFEDGYDLVPNAIRDAPDPPPRPIGRGTAL